MKSKNLVCRLLNRGNLVATRQAAIHEDWSLSRAEGMASPPAILASDIPLTPPLAPAPSIIVNSPTIEQPLIDKEEMPFKPADDPDEPPLICWKHKLYRQRIVDGGLEPYGPPVGDC
ncbi:MAG: hypothetical protein JST36_01285 [Bacteroidetes bacterium]|nr:hypothetical protein [Bacteroidota bacterium]